jgi:hypothetical protein
MVVSIVEPCVGELDDFSDFACMSQKRFYHGDTEARRKGLAEEILLLSENRLPEFVTLSANGGVAEIHGGTGVSPALSTKYILSHRRDAGATTLGF